MRQTENNKEFDASIDQVITRIEEIVKTDGRFDQYLYTRALSKIIGHVDRDCNDFPGYNLPETVGLIAGTKFQEMLPKMLLVRNKLKKLEATIDNMHDLGGTDNYVFLLFDGWQKDSPHEKADNEKMKSIFPLLHDSSQKERLKRVIIWGKRLQSRKYLVAMIRRFGKWEIHVRKFTSLKKLVESEFNIDNELSCDMFRFGDCRDEGYIASVKEDSWGSWNVDRVFAAGTSLQYTMFDINSTCYCLL